MPGHSASLLVQIVLHSPYCCVERVLMGDSAEDSVRNGHLQVCMCAPLNQKLKVQFTFLPFVWLYYNL